MEIVGIGDTPLSSGDFFSRINVNSLLESGLVK
jgi:hypothetical protein